MKIIAGIILCLAGTALASQKAQKTGPEDELVGFLPDFNCLEEAEFFPAVFATNDCNTYIRCVECIGENCTEQASASVWACKNDFYFDTRVKGCNYPEQVECDDRIPPTVPTQAPPVTTTRSTTTASPSTTTSRTTTTSRITTTGTGGNTFCPEAYGNFKNPYDCFSFYSCDNYVPTLINCQGGLAFNEAIGVCDYPENVAGCGTLTTTTSPVTTDRVITTDRTTTTQRTTTTSGPLVLYCPYPNGFFAIENYCGPNYVLCVEDYPFLETCPDPSIFNPIKLYCDDPATVDCFIDASKKH